MPRTTHIQTTFNAGELSPNLVGRTDFEPYLNGASILENFNIHPQGWLNRRKGTKFVAEVKDSTKKTRIIPFQFSTSQVYILELGDLYMRFFNSQAPVFNPPLTPYEIITVFTEADLPNIRFVGKDDIVYLIHPLRAPQKLIRLAHDNWSIAPVEFVKGPYATENIVSTNIMTLTGGPWTTGSTLTLTASGGHTPFQAGHVGALWRLRSGTDHAHVKITGFTNSTTVTVVAKDNIPASLQAVGVFTWSEGEFSNVRGFPTAITFHEQRLVLAGTAESSQKIWFSKSADFENFEVGTVADSSFDRTIAAQSNDAIAWLLSSDSLFIGTSEGIWRARNSANSAALSNSDISLKRVIGFGSHTMQPVFADNSPFYLQRGKQKLRTISFTTGSDRSTAVDSTIRSDHITGDGLVDMSYQQNPISTIISVREDGQAPVFTYESEQEVTAWGRFTTQGSFEYTSVIPSQSTWDEVYFVVKRTINGVQKRFIEVIDTNFKVDDVNAFYVDCGLSYNGTKSTTLSITGTTTLTMTAGVATFSAGDVGKEIHEINGKYGRALITGFTSSTVITATKLETFSSNSLVSGDWAVAVKTVSGLTHLPSTQVAVMSDGSTVPSQTVTGGGTITLGEAGSIIHVGLSYESIFRNMPIEVSRLGNAIGSSQGKKKRFDRIIVKVKNTRGGKLVDEKGDESDLLTRSLVDFMNIAPPLLNEDIGIESNSDWTETGNIMIKQTEPQPMSILSVTYYVTVNDF